MDQEVDDQYSAASLVQRHKESLFPSVSLFYDEPIELRRGERQFVYDSTGKEYLDFFGGILTVSSGHAIPEINDPIKEQLDRITHTSTLFLIRSQIELAERLREMTPAKLNKVFLTNSGTEANDAALLVTTSAAKQQRVDRSTPLLSWSLLRHYQRVGPASVAIDNAQSPSGSLCRQSLLLSVSLRKDLPIL